MTQETRMKLDQKWIDEFDPCRDAKEWLSKREDRDAIRCVEAVLGMGRNDWALWALPRVLNRRNRILYAVYASELSLPNYAAFNPNATVLTACHAAARAVAENDTEENRSAAKSAAESARSAERSAAESARSAAESARSAAWSSSEDKIIAEGMRLLREQEGEK